ncbi:DUF397 domain-containing protein [Thermobifida cellulosilytica]|uniref:DUF397 domain-containing protein n=1 Tax=Thermobifida cellulosilytica TB100 TaxID=665004 RepID=A0A147KET2_THECS|nr:DUF397 domain-containing protein [Thermobifida cellulosilytica]KUP95793.1 hypothetical protein AC529_15660 [Thermobifida cellulosilytica TB100]
MGNLIPDGELRFRKSSYSDLNNCVEVARFKRGAAVRDSEHRELGHLVFDAAEWQAFLTTLKNNEL